MCREREKKDKTKAKNYILHTKWLLKKKKEKKVKKERKEKENERDKEKIVEKKEIYKGRNTHSPSPTALEYKNTKKKIFLD